jgi:hypothetical protein
VRYTVERLEVDPGLCLPFPLPAEGYCQVLTTRSGVACDCSESGLLLSPTSVTIAVQEQLELEGQCGNADQPPCWDFCACEFPRAIGKSLIECKTQPESSADSAGWCYVSADAGTPQAELVADCPSSDKQRLRFMGNSSLLAGAINFLACADSAGPAPPRELGEVCFRDAVGARTTFPGYDVAEVNLTDGAPECGSNLCIANHFQGLPSCPYGQLAGAGDCFVAGQDQAVSVSVEPQLVERQAALASVCSCRCDGPGPGPFCACAETMQCEHLVEDLGLGSPDLAGSYCIPKGTAYDGLAPKTECVEPNCGVKHPY